MGCTTTFRQIVVILEDVAQEFLRHENSCGNNFLYILLFEGKFPLIPLLETAMGPGFLDLLVKDNHNDNMLIRVLGNECSGFIDRVIQTLRLMKEYNCVDIIHDVYASPQVYQTLSKNPRLKNYIT